jgi:hypothetical protein
LTASRNYEREPAPLAPSSRSGRRA